MDRCDESAVTDEIYRGRFGVFVDDTELRVDEVEKSRETSELT